MASLPLAGYRVLELAHLIAGPVCGMYLADMGADVVKIEHPVEGDASRVTYGAHYGAESAVFVTVNRNKRSVALDLGRAEGLALFRRLAARADVVIEAYRGGVAERSASTTRRSRLSTRGWSTARSRPSVRTVPGATSPVSTCSSRPWAASCP